MGGQMNDSNSFSFMLGSILRNYKLRKGECIVKSITNFWKFVLRSDFDNTKYYLCSLECRIQTFKRLHVSDPSYSKIKSTHKLYLLLAYFD